MRPGYRKLRPHDTIDRSKGDQFQDTGNGYWILARPERTGTVPHPEETWRRPVHLKPEHQNEETAPFT